MKSVFRNVYLVLSGASIALLVFSFIGLIKSITCIDVYMLPQLLIFSIVPIVLFSVAFTYFGFYRFATVEKLYIGVEVKYDDNNERATKHFMIGLFVLISLIVSIILQISFAYYIHQYYQMNITYKIMLDLLYTNNILLIVFAFYRLAIEK